MAQEKPRIWIFIFPDWENTGNLSKILKTCFYTGNLRSNTGKILKSKGYFEFCFELVNWQME